VGTHSVVVGDSTAAVCWSLILDGGWRHRCGMTMAPRSADEGSSVISASAGTASVDTAARPANEAQNTGRGSSTPHAPSSVRPSGPLQGSGTGVVNAAVDAVSWPGARSHGGITVAGSLGRRLNIHPPTVLSLSGGHPVTHPTSTAEQSVVAGSAPRVEFRHPTHQTRSSTTVSALCSATKKRHEPTTQARSVTRDNPSAPRGSSPGASGCSWAVQRRTALAIGQSVRAYLHPHCG
jgi:hypothetical protein